MRLIIVCSLLLLSLSVFAQKKKGYNHSAQQDLLPEILGEVYLGMPLTDFADKVDLSKAEVRNGFGYVNVNIPFEKENAQTLSIKVHGVSGEELEKMKTEKTVLRGEEPYTYETTVDVVNLDELPESGIVYEMLITYDVEYALKEFCIDQYGPADDEYKEGDDFYICDMEWFKKPMTNLNGSSARSSAMTAALSS